MAKQNAAILLNRYVWLIDTIYSAGHITREEIDRRWRKSAISEDEDSIPERTFHRYKDAIQELFQINIGFSKSHGYYIENSNDIRFDDLRQWLISTFAVSNMLGDAKRIRRNVSFEPMPSGQKFLTIMIEAIRDSVKLRVTHQGFSKDHSSTFLIEPYCLKIFKQRWYVLAKSQYPDGRLLVYGLDRFISVERTEDHYSIPEKFDADTFFRSFYGMSVPQGKPQNVRLKVTASQANYLRSLPLHHTQQEIEQHDGYSVFEYYLIPTYELRQEILTHGANIEVLAPQSLRDEISSVVKQMAEMYI